MSIIAGCPWVSIIAGCPSLLGVHHCWTVSIIAGCPSLLGVHHCWVSMGVQHCWVSIIAGCPWVSIIAGCPSLLGVIIAGCPTFRCLPKVASGMQKSIINWTSLPHCSPRGCGRPQYSSCSSGEDLHAEAIGTNGAT